VKHVFVETNFLVALLRPFPQKPACDLYGRHRHNIELHIPWCAFTEASRTLERIIREDLAFVDGAGRLLGSMMTSSPRPSGSFHTEVKKFINEGRKRRQDALFDYTQRLKDIQGAVTVEPPSQAAVQMTLTLFTRKILPPFDEMVLGTVLDAASALCSAGQTDVWFCNLNKNDFEPTSGNELGAAYQNAGLKYLPSFEVP